MNEPVSVTEIAPAYVREHTINPLTGLFLLGWTHLLNDGASNYLPGVLPAVLVELHIPLRLVGTVMAALLAGQALQPLWGWIADEVGGCWFVILGVGGTALGGALVGIAPGYWSVVGALLLIGTSSAMFHPQALAGIRMLPTRRPGLFMSVFLITGEFGRGLWPLAASLIAVTLGMKWLFLLALPAVLTLPFVAGRIPSLPRRHPDLPRTSLRRHLPDLAVLVSYSSLRATVQYSLGTFLPILWVRQGGSLVGGATIVTVLLIVGIAGNLTGGHLADSFGRRPLLMWASAISGVLLAGLLLSHGMLFWILVGALGAAVFATMPIQILLGQDILPENRSLGSGLALGFSNGVGAFAMIVLGLLAARWSIPAVLWINVGLCLIAVVMALFLPNGTTAAAAHRRR
jgi:MFS transporter, FSR family, fosmidomycin resistance protein